MTTKTESVTDCDGPGCTATNKEDEFTLAKGWHSLDTSGPQGSFRRRDFCSDMCVLRWAQVRLKRTPALIA